MDIDSILSECQRRDLVLEIDHRGISPCILVAQTPGAAIGVPHELAEEIRANSQAIIRRLSVCAPSIQEQTGWCRPHPQTMLQGFAEAQDYLLRITQYDFRVADRGFRFYIRQRGLAHLAGEPESRRWQFIGGRLDLPALVWRDENAFRADPYFQSSTAGIHYSDAELAVQWTGIRLARARLQDAWELYCQLEAIEIMRKWVARGEHQAYQAARDWQPPSRQHPLTAKRPIPPLATPSGAQLDIFGM